MVEGDSFFLMSYVLLWVLVLVETGLLFVLLRQVGHAYLSQLPVSEREGVPVGKRLPDVPTGPTGPSGGPPRPLFSLVGARSYTAVVLVTPTCPICHEAIDALRQTTAELPWLGATVLVEASVQGQVEGSVEGEALDGYAAVSAWGDVVTITDKSARRLQVRATPFAFVVDSAALVLAKGVVNTTEDLHRLLEPAKHAIGESATPLVAETR